MNIGQKIIDILRGKINIFKLLMLDIVFASFLEYIFNGIITHIPIYPIRYFYLKYIMKMNLSKTAFIFRGTTFSNFKNITIKEGTFIGKECHISGFVTIGKNSSITMKSLIQSTTHDYNAPNFRGIDKPVEIADNCWVGYGAVILYGAKMGKGSILGAGAVLSNKEIPDYEVWGGVPAKKLKEREKEACEYNFDTKGYRIACD